MCKRLLILVLASYWAMGAGGAGIEEEETRFRGEIAAAVTAGDDAAAAEAWNNLGTIYFSMGKLRKAEKALQKAMQRWKAAEGTPQQMAYPRLNLAVVLIEQRKFSESIQLIREARGALTDSSERYAFELAIGESILGRALLAVNRFAEAREALDSALETFEAHSSPGENLGTALFARATLERQEGRDERAETDLQAAIASWREALGPRHVTYASGLATLAVWTSKRHPERAGELFAEALDIMDSALAAGHPDLGQLYQAYGKYLRQQGRKREGKHYLKAGEEILRSYSRNQGIGMTIDLQALGAER